MMLTVIQFDIFHQLVTPCRLFCLFHTVRNSVGSCFVDSF